MYANLYVNLCEGINCHKSLPKQKTIIEDPDNIIQDFKTEVRFYFISNGNRTEWSPIRSVIIRVINKIGRPRSGSPICLITSMITD